MPMDITLIMCGIIGVFNNKDAKTLVNRSFSVLKQRGKDNLGIYNSSLFSIGHSLHSIVNNVRQPLADGSVFAANCEIYNWKELDRKYKLNASNDAEALFRLLKAKGVNQNTLNELDGTYAFCYVKDNMAFLARDILGVKPLWFSHTDGFFFASEKKALEHVGIINSIELSPRKILVYDIEKDSIEYAELTFFSAGNQITSGAGEIGARLGRLITSSVKKRIPEQKLGLMFSGGLDSTLIAMLLKSLGKDFTCYTTVIDDPLMQDAEDLVYAVKAAKTLGFKLKVIKIKPAEIPSLLKTLIPLIEDTNVVKVEVALTFFASCVKARKDGCRVIFSGLGSEEIFAGYKRHKDSIDINNECFLGLLRLHERDLYRDDIVTMHNGLELRLPFLDKALVEYALKIPAKYKIMEGMEKYILRKAALMLGLNKDFALRKKLAAQYGSKVNRAIGKLSRNAGFKHKSDYLRQFYPSRSIKLGALVSSGKDSLYAMHMMVKQGYRIECMISINSCNKDSFMFHTPAIELVGMQSKALGLPVFTWETHGEEERELSDLSDALRKGKELYGLGGIITGALCSAYQKRRIDKICSNLGLKAFSPLWHLNQESELRQLLDEGFKFIMVKVAAEGLDKSWLNREIKTYDVARLAAINKKIGINIAGEGGEYETLVLDCPLFAKRIRITSHEIIEDGISATLVIKNAELVEKSACTFLPKMINSG